MKTIRMKHIILWMLGIALCWTTPAATAQIYTPASLADTLNAAKDTETGRPSMTTIADTLVENTGKEAVNDSITTENARQIKAIEAAIDTTMLYAANDSISKEKKTIELIKKKFVPDPQRALWLSLVLPGAGQIYNKKYWKLPIIYGGFLGCTYALLWNQQMYMDYSQAYLDIMDDDPNTDSYLDMLPPRYDITGQEERFKKIFKNKKDHFRRFRDLSAFCFVGVYLLSVIDAYVDAQLSEFDITPDLSLRLEPAVIQPQGINNNKNAYGVGCSINF